MGHGGPDFFEAEWTPLEFSTVPTHGGPVGIGIDVWAQKLSILHRPLLSGLAPMSRRGCRIRRVSDDFVREGGEGKIRDYRRNIALIPRTA